MEKKSDKTIKKFNSRMQAKLLLVFCVITLLLVALMGRLIYIMQTKGDKYAKQVLSRETYVSSVLPYKRGDITDRNGTVLARSELQYKLILDPNRLLLNEDCIPITLTALKDNFGIDAETVQAILTDEDKKNSQYVILQKNIKYDTVQSYEAYVENFKNTKKKEDKTSIVGIWFEEEYVRSYPYASLACDVLGFTSADNTGFWGIEEYYNKELNGTNGREYGYYDSNLNIERIVKKAVNGNNVVSSIDINAQRIIQKHIAEFNAEFGSKNIGVLIMNPNNGEIIAMASNQEYDLNNPRKLEGIIDAEELATMTEEQKTEALNALWKNDVITSSFEPGSTFKPVTIAAGLEEGILKEEDTYLCNGSEDVNGVHIKCTKVHNQITLGEALIYSCNDALMQIAAKEGRDNFYLYQNGLGFGKKTGIDLPGEGTGITMTLDALNPVELATNSFGQAFNVTMVQMAAAYSSLVNGGNYYQPHIMKKIVNDNGATVKEFDKLLVRQTVSEKTSEFIQKYMYQTVETGTAGGAKVEGYAIGGKTGTAQKLPRAAKTYVVSFLGSVPAINPEIVIYVMIDEPQNVVKQADSSIATKFASRIMKELLPALGIFPEGDIDYLLPTKDETTGNGEQNQTTMPGTQTENTGNADNNENNENNESTENTENPTNEEDTQGTEGNAAEDLEKPEDEAEDTQASQTNDDTAEPGTDDGNGDPAEGQADIPSGEDDFNPDALE